MAVVAYLVNVDGIDLHAPDHLGRSCFFHACKFGYKSMAKLFIEKGVKVTGNDVSYAGFRPIDMARQGGHDEIVEMIKLTVAANQNVVFMRCCACLLFLCAWSI